MAANLAAQIPAIAAQEALNTACNLLDLWAQDELRDPWKTASEGFIKGLEQGIATAAFGAIMGPFGGTLLSAAAPIFVVTQVYFNGIGIYDALSPSTSNAATHEHFKTSQLPKGQIRTSFHHLVDPSSSL